MSRIREESGFSLPELLISTTVMIVVLLGALATIESFTGVHQRDEQRTAAQDTLRRGMDDLERRLRNLAAPSTAAVASIARATGNDLIFQTADPQKRWMRYCLDPDDPAVATGGASLWLEVLAPPEASPVPTSPPPAASCPNRSGWTSTTSVGQAVVNMRDDQDRPVFGYDWPADAAAENDTAQVTRVTTRLWVDTNPGREPAEQRLASGVVLRNQNRPPTARFSTAPNGPGVILNGAAASDPEGRRLEYHWYTDASPSGCRPGSPAPPTYLGTGVVLSVSSPLTVPAPSEQTVSLCVLDAGGLVATTSAQVTFP